MDDDLLPGRKAASTGSNSIELAPCLAGHDHVDQRRRLIPKAPELRSRIVRDHRVLAAGEDGGKEFAVATDRFVSHGIDASVQAV
jgi:hypothetical protein